MYCSNLYPSGNDEEFASSMKAMTHEGFHVRFT